MRVVLLLEDDTVGKHLHPYIELGTLRVLMYICMMVTSVPTKRWTLTLPKFDETFSVRFPFERFLGTDDGRCEGHTLG